MITKNRTKLFLENFLVYGLGGMISKFIPMIMLPIITRLYPSSEYMGLNDLSTTFISFASALAVCGMYDAMFRLFFDKKEQEGQKKVCSTALIFVTSTSIVLSILCFAFRRIIAEWFFGNEKYEALVIITVLGFLLTATNQIVSAPTRIQNKRKIFLVTNTITPLISYSIAIPLILKGYYIMAMPLATIISGLSIELAFGYMNHQYFQVRYFDKSLLRDLLKIGLPLLPNFLVYWIYNSADKVMISQILGNSYTGVYSVASRIGHISNLIYTAFSGGWLYFAYSTMEDDDQVQMKSNIFEYLGVISFACTLLLTAFSNLGFRILFTDEYIEGYKCAPYLFLAPLLLMLYQIIANQFTIIKKTYMNLIALLSGAILNIILNICMIKNIGIEGASIATVVGYIVSIYICLLLLKKNKLIHVNKKVYINVAILLGYYFVWKLFVRENPAISICLAAICELAYVFMYRKILVNMLVKLRNKEKK